MADSCQAGAGSESKTGCSGGSAGTIYVQFWVANRVLEHHEHPPLPTPLRLQPLETVAINFHSQWVINQFHNDSVAQLVL